MPPTRRRISTSAYERAFNSPDFTELQRRFRSFVVPATVTFLIWYFAYVLLAAFAPGFMGTRITGHINIGLVLGLLQFVSTFAITTAYWRWARDEYDPLAETIRKRLDEGESR